MGGVPLLRPCIRPEIIYEEDKVEITTKKRLGAAVPALFLALAAPLLWLLPLWPLAGGLVVAYLAFVGMYSGFAYLFVAVGLLALGSGVGAWLFGVPAYIGAGFALFIGLFSALVAGLLRGKRPFFASVRYAALAGLCAVAVGYTLATAFFKEPVAAVVDWFGAMFLDMPVQLQDSYFALGSIFGIFPKIEMANGLPLIDEALREELLKSLLGRLDTNLRVELMPSLFSWMAVSAIMGCYFSLRRLAKRGAQELATECIDISLVRISKKQSGLLFLGLLASAVLSLFGGALVVGMLVMYRLILVIYAVQSIAVAQWFLKKRGWQSGSRGLLIGAVVIVFPLALMIIGMLEQFFMFRGLGREELAKPGDDDTHKE